MIRTYEEAVKFLEQFIPDPSNKYPGRLGLLRMQYFMDLLGNPERSYKTIHVGGTSGKGSTSTFIASILGTRYRTGITTSPYLVRINERIAITQYGKSSDISDTQFIDLLNTLTPTIQTMAGTKYGAPSHFEIMTAVAFLYFQTKRVDFAVIEVGMGGRFDATNVVRPLACVLTNVGLDHTQVLGNTVEEIARDKAGIIKQSVDVITGVSQPSVVRIVSQVVKTHGASLSLLGEDFSFTMQTSSIKGSVFTFKGKKTYTDLSIELPGVYQVENAVIALRTIECLNLSNIKEDDLRSGLKQAYIAGRMEVAHIHPLVILDGAHNEDKIRALVDSIKAAFPRQNVTLLLGIKNDKDAHAMIPLLLSISQEVFLTTFRLYGDTGNIASYDPSKLRHLISQLDKKKKVTVMENIQDAYKEILRHTDKNDIILVTGSLYLIGEIKKYL